MSRRDGMPQELLDAEIAKRGWRIHKESGAYRMALRALAEIAQENLSPPSNHLAGYMDAADKVGMTDISTLQTATSGSDVVRRMALGTTLRGPLLDALVFLAQQPHGSKVQGN